MKRQWLFIFWLIHPKLSKTCPIKPATSQSKRKSPRLSGSRVMADQTLQTLSLTHLAWSQPCLPGGTSSMGEKAYFSMNCPYFYALFIVLYIVNYVLELTHSFDE
jgi:hypothetical protein